MSGADNVVRIRPELDSIDWLNVLSPPGEAVPPLDVQIVVNEFLDRQERGRVRAMAAVIREAGNLGEALAAVEAARGHAGADSFTDDLSGWRELARQDVPMLFPGFPLGAVTMLAGPGGSGKSTLSRGLILSVITGRNIFEAFPVGEPGRVVALSGEDSSTVFFRSMLTIAGEHGLATSEVDAAIRENLTTVRQSKPFAFLRGGMPTPEYRQLAALCKRTKPRLVVIDTARRYGGLVSENDAAEVGSWMQLCGDIAVDTGASVLVLHHAAKYADARNQNSVRGSGAYVNESRSVFTMARENETVSMHHAKSNLGVVPDVRFRLDRGGIVQEAVVTRDLGAVSAAVSAWLIEHPKAAVTVYGVAKRQGADAKALLQGVTLTHPWADSTTVARAIEQGLDTGIFTLESRKGANGHKRQVLSVVSPDPHETGHHT